MNPLLVKKHFFSALFGVILLIAGILTLPGCQAVFTFSPLAGLQRDPANLSPEGKIAYAYDILATGSQAEMAEVYALINELSLENPDDPELHLLSADLALGATGVNEAIQDFLSGGGDFSNATEDVVSGLDMNMVDAAADHVLAAEALGAEISEQQYLNTGVIMLGQAADLAGGFSNLDDPFTGTDPPDPGDPAGWAELYQANDFIVKGGKTLSDFGVSNSNF